MSQGKIELVGEDPRSQAPATAVGGDGFHRFTIKYDPKTQAVVGFDFTGGPEGEFKTWDFVMAVLRMAQDEVEFRRNVTRAQNMQAAAIEQAQAQQLVQQLKGRRNGIH
jgi:hypothetical protein